MVKNSNDNNTIYKSQYLQAVCIILPTFRFGFRYKTNIIDIPGSESFA